MGKKKALCICLDEDLLKKINEICRSQKIPPSRSDCIEYYIRKGLESEKEVK